MLDDGWWLCWSWCLPAFDVLVAGVDDGDAFDDDDDDDDDDDGDGDGDGDGDEDDDDDEDCEEGILNKGTL